jgi:phosphohistidine phosphatase SixA
MHSVSGIVIFVALGMPTVWLATDLMRGRTGEPSMVVTMDAIKETERAAMSESGRTIIVMRHAEKETGADPGLTERGLKRAAEVARLLAKSGAQQLICTEYRRTRMTLEPLAKALALEIEPLPAAENAKLAERCRATKDGETVVICGHSNTVPALLKALDAEPQRLDGAQMIPDAEFGRLYILHLPPATSSAKPRLTELDTGS